jgi:type IV fimbrial biogenesis protein FimT
MELMTALAVLGILIGIAVPSFRQFLADSRTSAFTNDLVTALNVARSEALRRASRVVVCASTTAANTLPTCGTASNWASGWVAFNDLDADNAVDAGELIRAWVTPVSTGMTMTARNDGTGSTVPRIIYDAMGMGALTATGFVRFTITPTTGCTGNRRSQTDVLMTGTVRSSRLACP